MQATTTESNKITGSAATNWRTLASPLVVALAGLLVIQLLAALLLGFVGGDMERVNARGPLLDFERDRVTRIRIETGDADPILVAKGEDGWIIPALGDLPAAEQKVTGLLSKLEGLQKGLPVATSEPALKRFKVAEDGFERKLTLKDGDTSLTSLYLGDSAGFRRLFVRADGDGSVYEAELGVFDAPDKADDWSDRTLLHLSEEDIRQLRIGDLTLDREEEGRRLADLAEGEEQDEEAIGDIVRRLANLDFVGVFAQEEAPKVSEDAAPVDIEAGLASGDTVTYRISKLEEGDDYLLEVSNRPQRFRLASYAAEEVTDIERADLLKAKESGEADGGAAETATEQTEDSSAAEPEAATAESEEIETPDAAEAPAPYPTPSATQAPAPEAGTPARAGPEPDR